MRMLLLLASLVFLSFSIALCETVDRCVFVDKENGDLEVSLILGPDFIREIACELRNDFHLDVVVSDEKILILSSPILIKNAPAIEVYIKEQTNKLARQGNIEGIMVLIIFIIGAPLFVIYSIKGLRTDLYQSRNSTGT